MNQTIRIDARRYADYASRYADYDDCLAAAAADAALEYGCEGYDMSPRWADERRDTILVDVPDAAARTRPTTHKGAVAMRTKITTDSAGRVTLAYDCPVTGDRVTSTYVCPVDGGYVRVCLPDGDLKQVCDGLSLTGSTLIAPSRAALPDIIRREHRRGMREMRRMWQVD